MRGCVLSVSNNCLDMKVLKSRDAMLDLRIKHEERNISPRWQSLKRGKPVDLTDSILNYRRYLKRKNYAPHTIKNYLHSLTHFILWLDAPIEQMTSKKITQYVDLLQRRRLTP